ncbi:MAG TPA: hypothetical protein VGB22_09430 [candidate division Zixibacteria bacterium]|jgi:hypothetical protein
MSGHRPSHDSKVRVLRTAFAIAVATLLCGRIVDAATVQFVVVGADHALARNTIDILDAAHEEMARLSGVALQDTVAVVYVSSAQSFDSVVGGHFPDWGVAAAVSRQNLIAVRSPAEHPLGRELRSILRHELAHLHLDAMTRGWTVPRWMHEGYAQQFGHDWRFGDDWTVARAVLSGSILPLRDIDGVNSFRSASAQLAYAQSYLAMGFYLHAYGWQGLQLFTDAIAANQNWDEALQAATGIDYAGFEAEFDDYLRSRYNWAAFLGDTALLWIVLVAAFVILYLFKRRSSRRRLAEWERQEEWADLILGWDRALPTRAPDNPSHPPRRQCALI